MVSKREMIAAAKEAAKPTLMDWVLLPFSPAKVRERMQDRVFVALAGSYIGADKSRRQTSQWATSDNDADGDILQDLPELRNRSRDLSRNNPLALGAINTKVTNILGAGLKLNAQIDAEYLGLSDEEAEKLEGDFEREWRLYSESHECDLERTSTFNELSALAFRAVLESGDIFINMPYLIRPGSPYGLKIQLIESDRCCNENLTSDTDKLAGGVERDEHGAVVRYHIADKHPGNHRDTDGLTWTKLDAFDDEGRRRVLHLFKKLRPGQSRGVPDLAPVIELLKQLGQFTEGELAATVISSYFTAFVKTEYGAGLGPMLPTSETGASSNDSDVKLAPAAIVDLAPGEEVEFANPGRPNTAFEAFVEAIIRQIGVALELPFELLVKHFTASYSAARAAMLEAWKYFSERRQWLARELYQPVYEDVITEAILSGRVKADKFVKGDELVKKAYFGAEWIGPPRGQIDPMKENQADKLEQDEGWTTLASNTAKRGNDWKAVTRQRLKEVKARKEIMELMAPPAPDNQNGDENKQPDKENEDDKTEDKPEE